MVQGFLDHIRTLLHSQEVEVSYFAAGILAHLTSRGEEAWTLSSDLRSSLLEQLVGNRQKLLALQYCTQLFIKVDSSLLPLFVSLARCYCEVARTRVWNGGLQVRFSISTVIIKQKKLSTVDFYTVCNTTVKRAPWIFESSHWALCLHAWTRDIQYQQILIVSHSVGHLIPSFPYWSAFTPLVSSCGRPGPCNMSAARTVRHTSAHTLNQLLYYFYTFDHSQIIYWHPVVTYLPSANRFDFVSPSAFAAARYCSMLLEEGGLQQLELVHTHPQTHKDVKRLAKSILESLQNHRARTGQTAPLPTNRRVPPQ